MKTAAILIVFLAMLANAFSATIPVSMSSTNGKSFGELLVDNHIKGTNTTATNTFAGKFQQGQGTTANGAGAAAFGLGTRASGSYSFGSGIGNVNSGPGAFVTGTSNSVSSSSPNSIVSGSKNVASGQNVLISGANNNSGGSNIFISGFGIDLGDGTDNSFAAGQGITMQPGASNNFVWNGDPATPLVIPDTTTNAFTVFAPGGIFLNGISFPQSQTQPYVAAGTNIVLVTNSSLVTIHGQPRTHVAAGTNIVTVTNGALVTVNAVVDSPEITTGYTNASLITIDESGPATPYPSTVTASSISDEVTSVSVSINGFRHNNPEDIVVILISPSGHQVKLMEASGSDALPGGPGGYANLVFSDSAPGYVPETTITSGTYRPTVRGSVGTPPAPATGPYYTNLSAFYGTDPNGAWGLYINDGVSLDGGFITNWSLSINSGVADFARLSSPSNHFLGSAGWEGDISATTGETESLNVSGNVSVSGTVIVGNATNTILTVVGGIQTSIGANAFVVFDGAGSLQPTNGGSMLTNINASALDHGTASPARLATNSAAVGRILTATSSATAEWTIGLVSLQQINIPTNVIPSSSALVTNYVSVNLTNTFAGGGIIAVATNYTAAGSFVLNRYGVTTYWP